MIGRSALTAAVLAAATVWSGDLVAQTASSPASGGLDALRRQVERRFDPLPLREGVNLRPKVPMRGVRSIEVSGGTIAVDGSPVTGAELRERIGDDADVVIQLSYLDADARRALFGGPPDATRPPADQPAIEMPSPPPTPDLPPRSRTPGRRNRSDPRVNIGGSVRVGADEVIDGDVVAVGGSAYIEGTVQGDVVAVGGSVDLGPRAVVEEDVAVIGGSLHRAQGSRIGGNIKEVGLGSFQGDWIEPRAWFRGWTDGVMGSTFAFVSTITRAAVLCLLAGLVVLLAGGYVDRISSRASMEPVKAGIIGFLAQLLFLPLLIITILVLVVTIVGIPLLVLIPFIVLGLGVVALVGFTSVAHQLGIHVGRRLGWANPSVYLTTFAGVVAILLPVLLARLALLAGGTGVTLLWHGLALTGFLIEYLAWTVGFGAVALVRFGRKPVAS